MSLLSRALLFGLAFTTSAHHAGRQKPPQPRRVMHQSFTVSVESFDKTLLEGAA